MCLTAEDSSGKTKSQSVIARGVKTNKNHQVGDAVGSQVESIRPGFHGHVVKVETFQFFTSMPQELPHR